MGKSKEFVAGVCKAKENKLLGDRLTRIVDGGINDSVKILQEVGFGGDLACDSPYDFEKLLSAEEERLNTFIRDFAPNTAAIEFLLLEYDYQNLKALIRAKYLPLDKSKMLGGNGVIDIQKLEEAVEKSEYYSLNPFMKEAAEKAEAMFQEERATGVALDCVFTDALYKNLNALNKDEILTDILKNKIDALNVSTALRSRDFEKTRLMFVSGGYLSLDSIKSLCEEPLEGLANKFKMDNCAKLIEDGCNALLSGGPLTELEKSADAYPLEKLKKTMYYGRGFEPFYLYCYEKRIEIMNVRIIMTGLLSGLESRNILSRLR